MLSVSHLATESSDNAAYATEEFTAIQILAPGFATSQYIVVHIYMHIIWAYKIDISYNSLSSPCSITLLVQ